MAWCKEPERSFGDAANEETAREKGGRRGEEKKC